MTEKDFSALLAGAALPETTVPVCLRGDLAAEHEELDRKLEKLLEKKNPKMADDGRIAAKLRIEELEAQMQESTYDFRLRALSRTAWHALLAEHQPRPGEDADKNIGVNTATFFASMIRACLVKPELTEEQWAQLLEKITDRQFDSLSDAAWRLNRRDVAVPFSAAASRMNQSSGDESSSPTG